MGNVRDLIRMGDGEVASFLAEPHKLQLASINPDGTPHLVTMYYALFDGRVGFWTYRSSRKAVNLRRDPRVTCLVEAGERYDELRGVQLRGRVHTIADPAEVLRIGTAVYARYVGGLTAELGGYLEQQATKRSAYLVEPQNIASWDHRKLAAASAAT